MKLIGYPRAAPDETLTSWLFRCSLNKGCRGITQEMAETYCSLDEDIDYDFDFSSRDFFVLCHHLQGAPNLISAYFKPDTTLVLHTGFRLSYCPLCIREHIRNYGLPVWRKTWCYVSAPFCMRHRLLLVHLSNPVPSIKSWCTFANREQVLDPHHPYYPRARQWGGVPIALLGTDLGIKVQSWLCGLRTPARYLRATDALPFSPLMVRGTDYLLQYFLHLTLPGGRGGGGWRVHISVPGGIVLLMVITFGARISKGVGVSTPYQRMIAMFLLGYLFDVFSERDLRRIQTACLFSEYRWFSSIEDLGYRGGPLS
ncbi:MULTISPECIES: TniQ family protein [unclassified Pseudomonas]|uniref:TniQ family protein n=1 Tax=unclassified Pseudomonas TaxID=196821 RepID=UPI001481F506|nr:MULTISPECIES: TniQ family protein [unclassified Pseudomonas]